MEARRATSSFAFTAMLVFVQLSSVVTVPEGVTALTPHAPIHIDGNSDFTPANGVVGGNGTQSDPYLIEGWEIDASTSTGITIMNTDAFFIVKDVYIFGPPSSMYFSFIADNVSDGRVENTTIVNAYGGLSLSGVMSFVVNNSTAQPVAYPMEIAYSNDVTVMGSDFSSGSEGGVYAWNSSNISITENEIFVHGGLPNTNLGIWLFNCTNCSIELNNITLEEMSTAIWLGSEWVVDPSRNITITANNITGAGGPVGLPSTGIWDWRRSGLDITISANTIRNTSFGIICQGGCPGISVYHNNFIENIEHVTDPSANYLDDGYPSGGNYWDNYTGVDDCSGPNQDVCPDPDGIGDTPYVVDVDTLDRYPLMNPVGLPPPTPPTPPRNLQAAGGCAEITLGWTAPVSEGGTAITNYRIYRGNTSGGEAFLVEVGDTLTFNDQGLTGGQTYFYQVSAVNRAGEGNRSNETNATARLCQAPSEPRNLQATPGPGSVNLTWSSPLFDGNVSITNYRIYRGNTSGGENFLVEIGNLTSYIDIGLSNGQAYYYKVSAVNGVGEGPLSSEANATPRTAPGPPGTLSAELTGVGFEDVTLTWTLSIDDGAGQNSIISYQVFRSNIFDPGGSGYSLWTSVPNGTTTFTDPWAGEPDPNDYFYRICALDKFANSTCSQTQVGKFTRFLVKGINFVSVPLILSDEAIHTVLQTLAYDRAWTFDSANQAWKTVDTSKPYSGTLSSANRSVGMFVSVTRSSNFTVAGVVPSVTTIRLEAGWNLVGFPSFSSTYTIGDLKSSTGATRVEGYDPANGPYHLRVLADGEALQPGFCYWIYTENQVIWTVDNS